MMKDRRLSRSNLETCLAPTISTLHRFEAVVRQLGVTDDDDCDGAACNSVNFVKRLLVSWAIKFFDLSLSINQWFSHILHSLLFISLS